MKDTMQAVVVRAPMAFDVETVPMPRTPEGGLLLKVEACGLCGSDLRTLRSGHRKVTLPWTIGHEIAKTRPVPVISNDPNNRFSGTVTLVSITSRSLEKIL